MKSHKLRSFKTTPTQNQEQAGRRATVVAAAALACSGTTFAEGGLLLNYPG